jgi:hypothetical protein
MSTTTAVQPSRAANGNGQAVAAVVHDDTLMAFIARAANDPAFDVAKFEALMRLRLEAEARSIAREFAVAMNAVQGELTAVARSTENDHTHSRYASYDALDRVVRPVYARHGFSLDFREVTPEVAGNVRVLATLSHIGGHIEKYAMEGGLDSVGSRGTANKTAIQAKGSTTSYLRRYLLSNIFNLATYDDNDGNDGNPAPSYAAHTTTTATRKADAPKTRPWRDITRQALQNSKVQAAWMAALAKALPHAPSASEVLALGKDIKGTMDTAPREVRAEVRKMLSDRVAAFSPNKPSDTKSDTANPSDKPDDAGDFPPDLEWAEGKITELSLVFEINTFLLMANDPKTVAKMADLAEHNRPLFERVRAAFQQRQDQLAREAIR